MTIFALLIAIVLYHLVKDLKRIRNTAWLNSLVEWSNNHLSMLPGWPGATSFAVLLALPLLLLLLLGWLATEQLGNLGYFIFEVIVLVYCLGPRSLEPDLTAVVNASSDEEKRDAAKYICDEELSTDEAEAARQLTMGVFQQALRRGFAIIFWFAVLGVLGAMLYRLTYWLVEDTQHLSDRQRTLFWRLREVMEWPVAQLMTLALAIAADFDSVFSAWKKFHSEQGHSLFEGDNGFLLASACQVVHSGHAAMDGFADQLDGPAACVRLASDMVWRVLGVWLTVLALLLLVGWIA
jgi:AmpE protein